MNNKGAGAKLKVNIDDFAKATKITMNKDELALMFDVSEATVTSYLVRLGLIEKKKKLIYHFDNELIVKMLSEGKTKNDVAKYYGISLNSMTSYIARNKLDPNYKPRKKAVVEEEEEVIDTSGLRYSDEPKRPFRCIIQGQRYIDVSCLYGV